MTKAYLLINHTRESFRIVSKPISGPQESLHAQADVTTEQGVALINSAIQEHLRKGYTCSLIYIAVNDSALTYRLDPTYAVRNGERCEGKFNLHMIAHNARYAASIRLLEDTRGYTQEPGPLTLLQPKYDVSSTVLDPCPICAGEVHHGGYEAYSCDSSFNAIVCENCGLYFDTTDESREEATRRWNTRVTA